VALHGQGKGTGQIMVAAKIRFNKKKGRYEIESFGNQYRKATNVRALKQTAYNYRDAALELSDTRHRMKNPFEVPRKKEMELCVRQGIESLRLVIPLLVEDMEETETAPSSSTTQEPDAVARKAAQPVRSDQGPPRAGEEVGSQEGCLTCPNFHADYTHDVPNTSTEWEVYREA